jgi:hypothetical protein
MTSTYRYYTLLSRLSDNIFLQTQHYLRFFSVKVKVQQVALEKDNSLTQKEEGIPWNQEEI